MVYTICVVRWPSGLRRTLGKRVGVHSPTWVRIPSSPPLSLPNDAHRELLPTSPAHSGVLCVWVYRSTQRIPFFIPKPSIFSYGLFRVSRDLNSLFIRELTGKITGTSGYQNYPSQSFEHQPWTNLHDLQWPSSTTATIFSREAWTCIAASRIIRSKGDIITAISAGNCRVLKPRRMQNHIHRKTLALFKVGIKLSLGIAKSLVIK